MQFSEREIMNRIKRINLQFIIEMKRLSQLSPAVVKANTGCDDRTIQLMKDIKEENIMKLAEEGNYTLLVSQWNHELIKKLTESDLDIVEFELLADSSRG